jgi:hypothetical protein
MANDGTSKYPHMERHDLTQGQLGDFKFTPVDQPKQKSLHNMTATAKQYLEGQLYRKLPGTPPSPEFASRASMSDTSVVRPAPTSQVSVDHEYFNKNIKPDLDESRLRLGPAALRTAVNGGSPIRTLAGSVTGSDLSFHRPTRSWVVSKSMMKADHAVTDNHPDPAVEHNQHSDAQYESICSDLHPKWYDRIP